MLSTMQDGQLGIARLLRHMARVNGRSMIVAQGPVQRSRMSFRETAERSSRLASALERHGMKAGDRIATFMCASREHIEAYLGVPYLGAVLHTVNVRMHDTEIVHICEEAEDRVFIVDAEMLERFESLAPHLRTVDLIVLVGSVDAGSLSHLNIPVIGYEDFLQQGDVNLDRAEVDERSAAILCHTGGTTGLPKGVAYSHRSLWLQANSLCTGNSLAISAADRLFPAVPLFHVNGWGLPFAAIMAGANLILPGAALRAQVIADLIRDERPTICAGVPTIWTDLLAHLGPDTASVLRSVQKIATGGAFVTPSLVSAYATHDVQMVQAWGMTETSSMSVVTAVPPWAKSKTEQAAYAAKLGRIACGLEARAVGLDGAVLPNDGGTVGEIQIRGPWVTARYFPQDAPASFQDGWLKTGDLGTLDEDGFLTLTDRLKDAIKSGGEWIPSLALEAAIQSHDCIREVAVIARPDERWQERPVAVVALVSGIDAFDVDALTRWIEGRVPRWWIPESWICVEDIPRTGVGKFDKKLMRDLLQAGRLGSS